MNGPLLTAAEVQSATDYIQNKLFYPATGLLYDRPVTNLAHFPTPAECGANDPNPCGYGGGMEDCMISGATMIEALLLQWEKEGELSPLLHPLVAGLLRCAESGKDGFLPRGLCPADGKSHYMDSSRDQYTMFLYALWRYFETPLCTDEEKSRIRAAVLRLARRAKENVTPENGYDLLREDGGRTLATTMWGPTLGNHEVHRLPAFYAAAYLVSGKEEWRQEYLALREEAMARALPMRERYYHLYTLQQMQASLALCKAADPEWTAKYDALMTAVAAYAEAQVDKVAEKIAARDNFNQIHGDFRTFPLRQQAAPNEFGVYQNRDPGDTDSFYLLQDAPNILITCRMAGLTPSEDALRLCREAFRRIDFATHHRATPIHFLNAHFQL